MSQEAIEALEKQIQELKSKIAPQGSQSSESFNWDNHEELKLKYKNMLSKKDD